jgi:histidinol-phosphate aminotransferase
MIPGHPTPSPGAPMPIEYAAPGRSRGRTMSYERDNIKAMRGYVSGEQLDGDVVKLNTNENPYPPAPEVAEALRRFDASRLRRYPNPLADGFRAAAARVHGIAPAQILASNGSDELLRLAFTTFVDPGATVAWPEPAYSLYPVLADIQGCRTLRLPLTAASQLPADFAERANDAGARLVCVVNPGAPAGQLIPATALRELADRLSGVLLIDEAYVDFVDPEARGDTLALVRDFDNVLLSRTLSKGYSLAGLRFGYAIGPEPLLEPMRDKTRDAYNLDAVAQALATAAIEAQDYAQDTWARVRRDRAQLAAALTALGFTVPATQTNFLLATVPPGLVAERLYDDLRRQRILVRYFAKPGLDDKLRISVGTPEENQQLMTAIGAHLEAA